MVNQSLKIDKQNDSQKNGFVGFDENEIYGLANSGAYSAERNGARSKRLFSDAYTGLSQKSIANKIHSGKNELQVPLDDKQFSVQELLTGNEIDARILENAKKSLKDETLDIIQSGTGEGLEAGLLDSFNPDFTANSVSFTYTSTLSESDNEDGVSFGARSPSASYASHPDPIRRSQYIAPYRSRTSNGGFGNSPLTNSVSANTLDSFLFTEKY